MKTSKMAAQTIALVTVLLFPGLCLAQNSGTYRRIPNEQLHMKANPSLAVRRFSIISGKVRLANPSYGQPTAANACNYITVIASKKTYISAPTGKPGQYLRLENFKPVRAVKSYGHFKQNGYCQFSLTGLPFQMHLYLTARYSDGWSRPLGGGPIESRPVGWANPITLTAQHASRANANLEMFAIPLR